MSPPSKRVVGSLTDLLPPSPPDQPAADASRRPTASARPATADPEPPQQPTTTTRQRRTRPAAEPRQDDPDPPAAADDSAGPVVLYSDLERKECRLREDQLAQLSVLSRRLQKSRPRGTGGERITDNTLIRVAIDVLLAHADTLVGYTEGQIRDNALKSIGGRRT